MHIYYSENSNQVKEHIHMNITKLNLNLKLTKFYDYVTEMQHVYAFYYSNPNANRNSLFKKIRTFSILYSIDNYCVPSYLEIFHKHKR